MRLDLILWAVAFVVGAVYMGVMSYREKRGKNR